MSVLMIGKICFERDRNRLLIYESSEAPSGNVFVLEGGEAEGVRLFLD